MPPKNKSLTKNCPQGKTLNPETKRCIKIKEENHEKQCPEGKVRNSKTKRCVKIKEEWNQQLEKEFHEILAQLRKPKLKGVFASQHAKPKMQEVCPICIKNAKTQELQTQIEGRKKPVNILIPRKKNKV